MLSVGRLKEIMMMMVTVALVAEYQNLNSGRRLKRIRLSFNFAQGFTFSQDL